MSQPTCASLALLLLAGGLLAPAAAQGTAESRSPAAPAPAASNRPAPSSGPASSASTASGAPTRTLTVHVPSGGDYTVFIEESGAAPRTVQDRADLPLPEGAAQVTVYVLDRKSGYAARKRVDPKVAAGGVRFASPDFRLLQKVRVEVTGKEGRPIAQGLVILTDGGKNSLRKVIQPASRGVAEFDFVVSGPGTLTVTPEGGSSTTKEVTLDLPKGETVQTLTVSLPEVTATVEPAAAPTPPSANAPAQAGNAPAAPQANAPAAPPAAPVPTQPAPYYPPGAYPPYYPPPSPGSGTSTLVGFLVLAAILFAGYLYLRNRGVTLEDVLKKLGVQPDAAGASSASAPVAPAPAPGAPPPPPPVVADPNRCPFCGELKDASGACACSVLPGAAGRATAAGPAPTGPRLVGTAGAYLGQIFPVQPLTTIGRDLSNTIALDRDSTASRRHAQITESGGTFRLQDLGSSNGTFVNGARVTEQILRPGDEIGIGASRFRFEV